MIVNKERVLCIQDEMLIRANEVIAAQPFSRLLGAKITKYNKEQVVLEILIREDLLQQHDFVHGGVLSYAADNALTFAGGTALGSNVLTAEFKINYIRPAVGTKLIAKASVVSAGRRQAVCRCDLYVETNSAEESKLCATAQGTIMTAAV